MERREVESWLNQAESWAAHMGQWKATVGMPPQVGEIQVVPLSEVEKTMTSL